jgi:hypothetical protein
MGGFPGVPVADDAEAGPDLDPVAPVAALLGDAPARPAAVAVLRGGEQPDDLDVVGVRQRGRRAQRFGPVTGGRGGSAASTSP